MAIGGIFALTLIIITIATINLLTGNGFTVLKGSYQNGKMQNQSEYYDYDYQPGGGNPLAD